MLLLVEERQIKVAESHLYEIGAEFPSTRPDHLDQPLPHHRAEGAGAGAAHQDDDPYAFR
ncbi:hypothetical protein Mro03_73460 [Microbispora rosea subsp. rosea]|nr:hypothetical protein Mro03_73460 [Microbispora rosea subsp. rosea]